VTIFLFPTEPDVVPDFYTELKQSAAGEPQMIIDLPLVGNPAYTNYSMHYQTYHQQPIAGGHFMRKPDGARAMTAFINQLLSPPLSQAVVSQPNPEARLSLLNEFGFTRIIIRTKLMATDETAQTQLAYLSAWLGQPKPAGDIVVFDIPLGGTSPQTINTLLAGQGWQSSDQAPQLRLQAPADMLIYVDAFTETPLSLQLSVSASDPDRYLSIDVDGRPAGQLYLVPDTLNYNLPLSLTPGFHQLTFYPEESCQQSCAPVDFSRLVVNEQGLPPAEPVVFADGLALIDYDISTVTAKPGQPILIYLYWQGQAQPESDYSAFLHLVAPSGDIIGQADYLLGGWFNPTSHWLEGQIVGAPSLVFIPTDSLPGDYRLQVGAYDAETGERLLTNTGANDQEWVILSEIIIEP